MNTLPVGSDTALAPLREALVEAARVRVDEIEHAARVDAEAALKAANRERGRIRDEAGAEGIREATAAAALVSARGRRAADERLLAQREAIRSELGDRVRVAVATLTTDSRYPDILEHLTARAQRILGPTAVVTVHEEGGVTAAAGTHTLDLTLSTLAAHKLDTMSTELASLWTA
jgi:vacuolar-type H+-ATPase subunit E/Vma4